MRVRPFIGAVCKLCSLPLLISSIHMHVACQSLHELCITIHTFEEMLSLLSLPPSQRPSQPCPPYPCPPSLPLPPLPSLSHGPTPPQSATSFPPTSPSVPLPMEERRSPLKLSPGPHPPPMSPGCSLTPPTPVLSAALSPISLGGNSPR